VRIGGFIAGDFKTTGEQDEGIFVRYFPDAQLR